MRMLVMLRNLVMKVAFYDAGDKGNGCGDNKYGNAGNSSDGDCDGADDGGNDDVNGVDGGGESKVGCGDNVDVCGSDSNGDDGFDTSG